LSDSNALADKNLKLIYSAIYKEKLSTPEGFVITNDSYQLFQKENHNGLIPMALEKEFHEAFSALIKSHTYKIKILVDQKKDKTLLCKFRSYKEFLDFILEIFKQKYSNVSIVFIKQNTYEVSGLIFRDDKQIVVYAAYGISLSSNIAFDVYRFERNMITEKSISTQEQMKFIREDKYFDLKVPESWINEQKLSDEKIKEVVEIYLKLEKNIKSDFETYFGLIDGKVFVENINLDFDGIVDKVEVLPELKKGVSHLNIDGFTIDFEDDKKDLEFQLSSEIDSAINQPEIKKTSKMPKVEEKKEATKQTLSERLKMGL
jgi:phosphoenolpyruvate synthase/pyruvate phosphate dikinase